MKKNTSVLSDEIYLQEMNKHTDNFLVNRGENENPVDSFELLKISVKSKNMHSENKFFKLKKSP